MALKTNSVEDKPLLSDATDFRAIGRDHRVLLRSTGHLFRDGRWLGEEEPFHVYREVENPGLGVLKSFQASRYFERYDPTYPQFGPQRTYNWRPSITRSYMYEDINGGDYFPLPQVEEPSYSDFVLELNAHGTELFQRYRPGNPAANLFQFVGELHDLPRIPLLFKQRTKRFSDLGSEYLNVEFGWRPFVTDLIKLYQTQQTIRDRLNKLIKDNGISIRRRSKHDEVIVSDDTIYGVLSRPFSYLSDTSIGGNADIDPNLFISGPFNSSGDGSITGESIYSMTHRESVVTWYCGTYKYYVPNIGSDEWTERAKRVLFGGDPTPRELYALYPWTWLVDWFSNVGQIVSNLTSNAVDNEAVMNSYIMQDRTDRTEVDVHISWDYYEQEIGGEPFVHIDPGTDHLIYSLIKRNKLRQRASPFGFGLSETSFTARQKTILAALAGSRKRPHF